MQQRRAGQENAADRLFVVLLAEAGDADVGVRDGFARRPHGVADAYVGAVLQGSAVQLPDVRVDQRVGQGR